MSNWQNAKMGEITNLVMGQSPDGSSVIDGLDSGLPFLQGCTEFTTTQPNPVKSCLRPLKVAPKNSMLISVRAPVGTSNWSDRDYCIGRGLASLEAKPNFLDPKFLKFLVEFNTAALAKRGQGSTFEAVGYSDVFSWPVSLPPLDEQRRIAEILSTVDGQIDNTVKEIEIRNSVEDGLTQTLVKGNNLSPFGEFIQIRPSLGIAPSDKELVSFLPMECLSEDGDILKSFQRAWLFVKQGFTLFQSQDTLVAKITPCFENGKGAFIGDDIPLGAGSTEYHVLRAKEGVAPRWVYWITRAKIFRIKGAGLMEGSAGQQRVPKDFVERFMVQNPFNSQTARSLSALDENQQVLNFLRKEANKLISLKAALMNDLLTGKLRVSV